MLKMFHVLQYVLRLLYTGREKGKGKERGAEIMHALAPETLSPPLPHSNNVVSCWPLCLMFSWSMVSVVFRAQILSTFISQFTYLPCMFAVQVQQPIPSFCALCEFYLHQRFWVTTFTEWLFKSVNYSTITLTHCINTVTIIIIINLLIFNWLGGVGHWTCDFRSRVPFSAVTLPGYRSEIGDRLWRVKYLGIQLSPRSTQSYQLLVWLNAAHRNQRSLWCCWPVWMWKSHGWRWCVIWRTWLLQV